MIRYHVVDNDEIGGFDVSIHDKPMSQHGRDESSIAWGLPMENAELIAKGLNVLQWAETIDFEGVDDETLMNWLEDNFGRAET